MNTLAIITKIELKKLFQRKDSWLMFTILLVPILYSVGLASKFRCYHIYGRRQYNGHRLCQCNVSDEPVYVHFQCDFICNRWKKFSVRN